MTEATQFARRHWVWLTLILAVGVALRTYRIGALPFWLDEAHTANFIRLHLGEIWSWANPYDKGNPPGYVTLLKIWAQVSHSDAWLRAFSALAGILTLPVVYLIGRRLADRAGALMATALLALSGYHIRFSQEARAYALMALVTALAMAAVTQLIAQPDGDTADRVRGSRPWRARQEGLGLRRPLTLTDLAWPVYALAAGSAFLFHDTGIAVAVAANITVAVWWLTRRPKPPRFARNWILANVAVLAIWMTWIPGFLNQVKAVTASYWVPAPTFFSVAQGGADLAAPSFGWNMPWNQQNWWAVLVVAGALALVWLGTRSLSLGHKSMIWAFLLTLPAIETLFSLRQPIFLTRTLTGVLVPACLAVGVAVTRRRGLWPLAVAVLAVSAFGAVAYHASYQKTAWDRAATLVASEADSDTVILVQPANTIVAFDHYYTGPGDAFGAPSQLPGRTEHGASVTASDRVLVGALARQSGDVWLVLNRPDKGESLQPTLDEITSDSERTTLPDLVVIHYRIHR